jgi:hypothetical protein
MTQCTGKQLVFSRLKRQQIVADFDGGRLTSDAGALLLREVDRKIGLTEALADCIADRRDPAKIRHGVRTMLAQRIFGIALGYEDLNDQKTLRDDPLMAVSAQRRPDPGEPLASPSTLCRFENAVTWRSQVRMGGVLVDQFIASYEQPPKELIFDFDATDDPLHGNQVGRFFHGYYDCYCFLPLYVFCGEHLLTSYLRPSNIDPAKHARPILKLLVDRVRQAWPDTRIIFRGDSGFCRWKLLRWCEGHQIGYVVGIARNKVLERKAARHMKAAEKAFQRTGQKQRNFHEFHYAAGTWDRKRRVIVKAERLSQGPNCRFVVTNLSEPPQEIYDGRYTARGDMENRIKEQQLELFADRTSCHDFAANQFRLLLASAAYVLLEHLRRVVLAGTQLARAQVGTIRVKLLKVAARVVTSVRRVVFHLSSSYPYQALFRLLVARLTAS